MPDEAERFGGLSDALQDDSQADEESTDAASDDEPGGASSDDSTAASTAGSRETTSKTTADESANEQAFPEPFGFAETSQQSYYVRDETFDPLSANRSRIRAVASKHGLDEGDLSKRELHDAELSVLQSFEDWDIAVAIEVLERRGVAVDEDDVRAVFEVLR